MTDTKYNGITGPQTKPVSSVSLDRASLMAELQQPDEDDYMGDLSLFLPPEQPKKTPKPETLTTQQPSKKKPKLQNWQQRRKLDRERQQHEEDERTLVNMESEIPQTNIGFKMLKQMGYKPGSALGRDGAGSVEPVGLEIRRSRAGLGREDPVKEKIRKEVERGERERREVEGLMVEFKGKKKEEWRSRRVFVNYYKAKASLAQLENEEVVEPEKKEDGEEPEEEEEEEEVITEEDLHEVLLKLRNEHHYCFFCGCQYESMEALLSNCPGIDEDDH